MSSLFIPKRFPPGERVVDSRLTPARREGIQLQSSDG